MLLLVHILSEEFQEIYWSKVNMRGDNQCWECLIDTTAQYPSISVDGKSELMHRITYCMFNYRTISDIKGKLVRHVCHNTKCVNPAHLVLGTGADNAKDTIMSGRKYGIMIASEELVREAFKIYLRTRDYDSIAWKLGISYETARRWILGRTHIAKTIRKEYEHLL